MPLTSLTLLVFLALPQLLAPVSVGRDLSTKVSSSASDSLDVIRTVSRFHEALKNGDTTSARSLLASDLRVLEAGDIETRVEYLSSHLPADMDFAKAVAGERKVVSYSRQGNVAWVVSSTTAKGRFGGRDVDSVGAELMVLSRTRNGWRIRAIHWSSRRATR